MEELDIIRKAEDGNYRHARKMTGPLADLVEDFVRLYAELGGLVLKRHRRHAEMFVIVGQSLMACRTDLTLGALAALRGHTNDSFLYSRRAIEFCAFAAAVQREPRLAEIWRNSGHDRPSYNKYLRTFRTEKLFPREDPNLNELAERYNLAAKYAHPSRIAFAGRVKASTAKNDPGLLFDYFQVSDSDPSEPARTLLWVLNAHFYILMVFERLLAEAMGRDKAAWETLRNDVLGRLDDLKSNWGPIVRSEGKAEKAK